jgi:hypothetical protein
MQFSFILREAYEWLALKAFGLPAIILVAIICNIPA